MPPLTSFHELEEQRNVFTGQYLQGLYCSQQHLLGWQMNKIVEWEVAKRFIRSLSYMVGTSDCVFNRVGCWGLSFCYFLEILFKICSHFQVTDSWWNLRLLVCVCMYLCDHILKTTVCTQIKKYPPEHTPSQFYYSYKIKSTFQLQLFISVTFKAKWQLTVQKSLWNQRKTFNPSPLYIHLFSIKNTENSV